MILAARSIARRAFAAALALAMMAPAGEGFAAGVLAPAGPSPSVTVLRGDDDDAPAIAAGQKFTLSIGVDNLRGGAAAQAAVLKVTLPAGLSLEQAMPAAAPTSAGPEYTWKLDTLKAGAFPRIIEITLASADSLNAGANLTIHADVTTADNGSPSSNSSSAYTVQIQPAAAALAVETDLRSVPFTASAPVKFAAAVNNLGTVAATASALTLTLPPKVSFQSSDPPPSATTANSITWQLGDIGAGESHGIIVTVALDQRLGADASEPESETSLPFKLDASTSTTGPGTTGLDYAASHLLITRHVESAGPDLKVWLSVQGADTPGELPVGKDVTYTIEYGNFGNAPAQHASVSLSLWEGLSFRHSEVTPTATAKSDKFGGGVLTWDVGDLPVGRSSVIKSQVHVDSVPETGSLVMATISTPGGNVNLSESTAYSWRRSARSAGRTAAGGAARSGHAMLWVLVVALLAPVVWMVHRARSKPAPR
jgi:hypothetical protein